MIGKVFFYLVLIPALLPVAFILFYVYSKDKQEREPFGLLLKTFIYGAIFALPCIPIEGLMCGFFSSLYEQNTIEYALFDNILGVALVEETFKFLVLMIFIWKNKNFDFRYDGIVYAVTSSLGFAAIENVMYVLRFGTAVSIGRAVFAIPGHASFGVLMGFFFSRAKDFSLRGNGFSSVLNLALSLFVPMIVHGFYDFLLSGPAQEINLHPVFFVYVIVIDVVAFFTIRHDFKTNRPLGVEYTVIE